MKPSSAPPAAPAPRQPAAGYLVEVLLKPEFTDADGLAALRLLRAAGAGCARRVRVGRLYELRGPLNLGHVHAAARELLCDCVTQEFRVGLHAGSLPGAGPWRAEVWPRLADPSAETVSRALAALAIPQPVSVRCGLAYHILVSCGRGQIERAVAHSLANPLIHSFAVQEAA